LRRHQSGGNGPNEGPALLDFLAAAIRTEDLSLFVIDEGQDFGEVFLTIVAEEIVVGHTTSSGKVAEIILELATAEHNLVLTSPV
jgi:hypothetical protein